MRTHQDRKTKRREHAKGIASDAVNERRAHTPHSTLLLLLLLLRVYCPDTGRMYVCVYVGFESVRWVSGARAHVCKYVCVSVRIERNDSVRHAGNRYGV